MDAVAHLEKVGVSRGGSPVLVDIDFTLDPGACIGIAGPNGSGKTTLVRAIATLIAIDTGRGTVLGADLAGRDVATVRSSIGLIGHHPTLIPELTLSENLTHVAKLAEVDVGRVPHALDVVGLTGAADRRAQACSFGMQRRVEIAHLLLTRPSLLLLDEAASGLDEAARALVGALVESVRGRAGAAIVVSHDRSHLTTLCDTVLDLRGGRLGAAA
ncbi:MAG: ABC transporter ATP-binding protein [Acidimicrobiia bacterium]